MNERVGSPRIGQWYLRGDKGETFQVTGIDEHARTIDIQGVEGDLDEIDANDWSSLPLDFAESPEDWTQSVDADVDDGRGGGDATETGPQIEPIRVATEEWEDASAEEPSTDHPKDDSSRR